MTSSYIVHYTCCRNRGGYGTCEWSIFCWAKQISSRHLSQLLHIQGKERKERTTSTWTMTMIPCSVDWLDNTHLSAKQLTRGFLLARNFAGSRSLDSSLAKSCGFAMEGRTQWIQQTLPIKHFIKTISSHALPFRTSIDFWKLSMAHNTKAVYMYTVQANNIYHAFASYWSRLPTTPKSQSYPKFH